MRETFVMRDGKLVPKHMAAPMERHGTIHIIPDGMGDTWHPVTGKFSDSKSAFRRMTKEAGCEEVGNERPTPKPKSLKLDNRQRREDIQRAIYELRNGYGR